MSVSVIDHYALQRLLIQFYRKEGLVCRVRAAQDHNPLKKHPEFFVPKDALGKLSVAQVIPAYECLREYLWFCVKWQGFAGCDKGALIHYRRDPETTIWGDALYVVEDLTLVDIVTKEEARKQPLRGQSRLF